MAQANDKRVAVITGASAGIGKAAAKALVARGWRVIGQGRDPARSAEAEAEIGAIPGADFTMLRADLTLMSETARMADAIAALTPRVDALLNNAGGMRAERILTVEGHEATFAGNHLAPFLLTQKLMPFLKAAAARTAFGAVRVVGVASQAHEYCDGIEWDDLTFAKGLIGSAYCHAKLANILFARELARRVAADGIVSYAMHPGVVASNFSSHCEPATQARIDADTSRSVSPEHAAETLVWLASAEAPGHGNGRYFHDKLEVEPSPAARDDDAARRLWKVSEALVAGY